jgi:hypothetical protein
MHNIPNAPAGQKSMSMWTKPETPEQRAYFSTHAPKRRVYGLIQTLLQAGHTALALAAWTALFSTSLAKIGVPPFYIMCISGLMLIVLHVLFRVTWETFWYDKLDKDTRTDSSPFLPIGIMIVLLITEKKGATEFLTKQVDPIVEKTTASLDSSHQAAIAALKMDYQEEVTRIEQSYAKAEETATKGVDASISAWQRKQIISDNDRNWVNSNIATLNTSRGKKVEQANVGKSDALAKALADYNTAKGNLGGRHGQQIALVDGHNTKERDRYEAELGEVDGYAWLISLFFLLAIGALGYARVRINVMSGILPVRNYTVLDQHGSFIERIQTAIGDAMNRRGLQAAVWIHRYLSPDKPLQSFDGTVVATPGEYNSHGVQSAKAYAADRIAIRNPPATKPATTTPSAPGAGSNEMERIKKLWKGVVEFGDSDDEIAVFELRRTLLEDHGIVTVPKSSGDVKFYQERISVAQMEQRHPMPKTRAFAPVTTRAAASATSTLPATAPIIELHPTTEPRPDLSGQVQTAQHGFKTITSGGQVVGLQYIKQGGQVGTIDLAGVRSNLKKYQERSTKGEVSDAVAKGLDRWEYAISLFN